MNNRIRARKLVWFDVEQILGVEADLKRIAVIAYGQFFRGAARIGVS